MSQEQYPPLFLTAVEHVLRVEGGYIDHPNDKGGATNYGISQRQYPHLNIARLTRENAIEIYYDDYWRHYQCDKLPAVMALFLFDAVINHRPKTAVKFIQKAFRVSVDGIIGPETLGAVNRFKDNADFMADKLLLALSYRADFYHDLALENPSQEAFIMGWFRRLFKLQRFINSMES